jgi:hypothetical protein
MQITIRKKLWLVYQDVYLDENTRISYGWHFLELGNSYHLQRKINGKWRKVAWTYFGGTVESIYGYLLQREKKHQKPTSAYKGLSIRITERPK